MRRTLTELLLRLGGRGRKDPEAVAWREAQAKLKDPQFYRKHFQPWRGYGDFGALYEAVKSYTIVTPQNCWILYSFARHVMEIPGDFAECGVYRGGTARLLSQVLSQIDAKTAKKLHLFDTFSGMPKTDAQRDWHRQGDFADTSEEHVKSLMADVNRVSFHKGLIPETFRGMEEARFSFVHIDLDIYQAIIDACEFMYPRLQSGGVMIFDDYCYFTCPGARAAVDEFFMHKPEKLIVMPHYQALVVKH
jgi:O-methyltransferase